MTVVHGLTSRWRRAALVATLACGTLAFYAGASTEVASAHGNCYLDGLAPYKSPSGAQIRGTGVFSCDFKHKTVKVCVAIEQLLANGQYEPYDDVPHECRVNPDAFSAKKQAGRPCVTGTYRTVVKGHAVDYDGDVHQGTFFRGPSTIVCPATDLLKTTPDDLLWLAG